MSDRPSRDSKPRTNTVVDRARSKSPKALPKNRPRFKTPPPSASRRPRSRSKTPPPSSRTASASTAANVPKAKATPPYLGMPLEEAVAKLPLARVQEYEDDAGFEEAVKRCVPSEFVLIASQDEVSKAQEDYTAMNHYKIPLPTGKQRWLNSELAGSCATTALLQLMYENPTAWVATSTTTDTTTSTSQDCEQDEELPRHYSTLQILEELQERIKKHSKQDANPTISSSRPLGPPRFGEGVYAPYYIVPSGFNGTRRALLIGCVTGEEHDLKGPLNDIKNIERFLIHHCGFLPDNIAILEDSPKVPLENRPTKKNIIKGWADLIAMSKPNDVNFIQFSGHGNRDYTNLYLMPSDYKKNGYIVDDFILNHLIKAMPAKVYTTFLVDCCYSGTVGELPYILKASSSTGEQELQANFDTTEIKNKTKKPSSSSSNDNSNNSNNHKKKQRRHTQQIERFYDMDTRQEAIAKEQLPDKEKQEHRLLKQARRLKRNLMHFDPIKLVQLVAAVSIDAADKIETGIGKAVSNAKGKLTSKDKNDKNDKAASSKQEDPELQSAATTPMQRVKLKDGTYTSTPVRNRSKSPMRPGRVVDHPDNNDKKSPSNKATAKDSSTAKATKAGRSQSPVRPRVTSSPVRKT